MDADRFDALSRALAAPGSRRGALAAALGGALGLLNLSHSDDASAAKSGKCKPKCGECEKCQKGDCERKNGKKRCKRGKCQKANGTPCSVPNGGVCQNRVCACPGGSSTCGGACVNLQTDEANCGSCGTVCAANQVCQAGTCFPSSTCPATLASACAVDPGGTPCTEAPGEGCFCGPTAEGNVVCFQNELFCPGPTPCTTSADCPAGEACIEISTCCGFPAGTKNCLAPCAAP